MPRKIMSYFPSKYSPRSQQKDLLEKIEKEIITNDVIIINAPVSVGKSACSMTISKFFNKKGCSIIVPNKLLVNQYDQEFGSQIHVMRGKADYWCSSFNCKLNMRPKSKLTGTLCSKELNCQGCNKYRTDCMKSRIRKSVLSNFYTYVAHKMYRDVLVIDEAHTLINTLKDMASATLWHHAWKIPSYVKDRDRLDKWINDPKNSWQSNLDFQRYKKEFNEARPNYIFSYALEDYRKEKRPCFKMTPVDLSQATPFMWPSSVKKIILMSATISYKDIEQMGLGNRKTVFLECDSPIPAARRPVILAKNMSSMSYKNIDANLEGLAKFINRIADKHSDSKGLIHLTYGLKSKLLKSSYLSDSVRDRLITHTQSNKTAKYNQFKDSEDNSILIGSGMEEGLDLAGPDFGWQVIGKVPWPSLAEPAIKFSLANDPELYAWNTAKLIIQATGRICRGPEDFGATYIYDSSILRLLNNNPEMFPTFYRKSIIKEI